MLLMHNNNNNTNNYTNINSNIKYGYSYEIYKIFYSTYYILIKDYNIYLYSRFSPAVRVFLWKASLFSAHISKYCVRIY